MQKLIKNKAPELYNSIPHNLWNHKWVVHCKAVGTGQKAVKYLSEYVFRPAISNNRILSMDNNFVTFTYKDSKTQFKKTMKLSPEEFIRRYLQHVLPKGFVKVRYFGLFSNTNRKLLAEVKERLPHNNYNYQNNPETEKNPETEPADVKTANVKSKTHRIIICPHCNKPMRIISSLPKLTFNDKSPPHNKFIHLYSTSIR